MSRQYNTPPGSDSDIGGVQIRTDHYIKRALIEARKLQYFMPLSGTVNMPKHMGKTIKKYHYIPLLDDENINSQGLDAAGAVIDEDQWEVTFQASRASVDFTTEANADTVVAALTADNGGTKSGAGPWTVTFDSAATSVKTTSEAAALLFQNTDCDELGAKVQRLGGNIYGSSKDAGTITSKLPSLTENGGRVNRVGFKRKQVQGSIEKFGFFDEYTQESMDFDTDAELMQS